MHVNHSRHDPGLEALKPRVRGDISGGGHCSDRRRIDQIRTLMAEED